MTIAVHLELHLKNDIVRQDAYDEIHRILDETRGCHGNLGVETSIDLSDPLHLFVTERWATSDDLAAYRQRRKSEGGTNIPLLVRVPLVSTQTEVSDI